MILVWSKNKKNVYYSSLSHIRCVSYSYSFPPAHPITNYIFIYFTWPHILPNNPPSLLLTYPFTDFLYLFFNYLLDYIVIVFFLLISLHHFNLFSLISFTIIPFYCIIDLKYLNFSTLLMNWPPRLMLWSLLLPPTVLFKLNLVNS